MTRKKREYTNETKGKISKQWRPHWLEHQEEKRRERRKGKTIKNLSIKSVCGKMCSKKRLPLCPSTNRAATITANKQDMKIRFKNKNYGINLGGTRSHYWDLFWLSSNLQLLFCDCRDVQLRAFLSAYVMRSDEIILRAFQNVWNIDFYFRIQELIRL